MKLSTASFPIAGIIGGEACLRLLKDTGFDAVDWSFFEMANGDGPFCAKDWHLYAQKLRIEAQEIGIAFGQAHAPFPSTDGTSRFDSAMLERIRRAIEVCGALGVHTLVVHPPQHLPYAQNQRALYAYCVDFYRALIPHCAQHGVRMAAENMYQYDERRGCIVDSLCAKPEEFCALLDEINSPFMTACLDIGHSALTGTDPAAFIRTLGHDRLQALHVHDVDYRNDCHTLPFLQKLDWESIAQALAAIDYAGDFTFECHAFFTGFPIPLLPDAARLMAQTGRYLISRINHHK